MALTSSATSKQKGTCGARLALRASWTRTSSSAKMAAATRRSRFQCLIVCIKRLTSDAVAQNLWRDHLHPRMKQIAVNCLDAAKDKLFLRSHTFELYGFDFLVDENLTVP